MNETLSSAGRIGFLGDTHGDLDHVLIVSRTMQARGIRTLVILGDFGFIWPGRNWDNDLDKLSRRLIAREQTLFFVDGNHEDFERLYRFPLSDDGLRWLRPNIAHIPRGYRTVLASGVTLAALGGANSVDVGRRMLGRSWWAEESITEADLARLGHQHTDVLIGHDAPLNVPMLDQWLGKTNHWWPETGIEYSEAGRAMFYRGFLQVQPNLSLGGHYHHHVDETVDFDSGDHTFTTRVVILDTNGPGSISQAILNVETLSLDYFGRADETVHALTGREHGRWRVSAGDSSHVFDLDNMTVTRVTGTEPASTPIRGSVSLAYIETCRVGEPGRWMLHAPEALDPGGGQRYVCSEVRSIHRIPDDMPTDD